MGRKKTLCRGVADAWGPVAAAAGGADGHAGVSACWAGLLGRSRELGRPTHDAGLAYGPSRPRRLRGFPLFFSFSVLFSFFFI